ncbi:hypothetical protein KY290_036318 [Solanum tuberosum]|uniref:Uncharacterized protein n=1 Tax=Solanum tuberosum TaxID=4113 RepID=A0ABQ7TU98_SOLTU|nr:hypothetical protein KY290_036318 [Solanum tuberosum]
MVEHVDVVFNYGDNVLQLQLFIVKEGKYIVPALDISQLNEPFPIIVDAVFDGDISQLNESLHVTVDTIINGDINQLNEPSVVKVDVVTDGESSEEEKGENEPFASDHDSDALEFLGEKKKRKVKKGQGFEINTLETEHTCQEAFKNRRATQQALSHYFKNKIQNNPKYKVKDMRQDVDDHFSLNISYSKMKRVKRLILEKLEAPQPSIEVVGPSNLKRKAWDKPVAPSKRSIIDEDEDEDELESENETTIIRPRAISEVKTRLQMKKLHQLPTCSRKINFGGMRVM